ELRIIQLRTSGVRPGEIAKRTGVSRQAIYARIHEVYQKTGLSNTAQLTRWAIENALDEALEPETEEPPPVPEPKPPRRTKPQFIRPIIKLTERGILSSKAGGEGTLPLERQGSRFGDLGQVRPN